MFTYHLNLFVRNVSIEVDESTFYATVKQVDFAYNVEKLESYYYENSVKHTIYIFNALDGYGENLGTFGVIHEVPEYED